MIGGAFRYNAENVRYHATPWMAGDGSTSSGTLLDRHGNPISSGKLRRVDAIHRTDWQGRQLLYAMARTNVALSSGFSNGLSDVPTRSGSGSVTATSSLVSPMPHATGIHLDPSSVLAFAYGGAKYSVAASTAYKASVFVVMDDGLPPTTADIQLVVGNAGGSTSAHVITALTGGIYLVACAITSTAINLGNNGVKGYLGARKFSFTGLQISSVVGTYIPTTTTAVTVTDYTLTGPSVALGQVPAVGAVLDWDGVAKR